MKKSLTIMSVLLASLPLFATQTQSSTQLPLEFDSIKQIDVMYCKVPLHLEPKEKESAFKKGIKKFLGNLLQDSINPNKKVAKAILESLEKEKELSPKVQLRFRQIPIEANRDMKKYQISSQVPFIQLSYLNDSKHAFRVDQGSAENQFKLSSIRDYLVTALKQDNIAYRNSNEISDERPVPPSPAPDADRLEIIVCK